MGDHLSCVTLSYWTFMASLACVMLSNSSAVAQALPIEPTLKDVPYDTQHSSQVLDVYQSPKEKTVPAVIYIHGGGWAEGSKRQLPLYLLGATQAGLITTISVEYRFSQVAKYPAQVNDCMRAIQFVRANAAKWKIDPDRIGVMGGSAGAHLALWVALHDDIADPKAKDPVERESSRVACAVSCAGPTDFSLITKYPHIPHYKLLFGFSAETPPSQIPKRLITSASPISYASKDDPPVLLIHGDLDEIVPLEHATRLEQKLKGLGVDVVLEIHKGKKHEVAGGTLNITNTPGKFLAEKLKVPLK